MMPRSPPNSTKTNASGTKGVPVGASTEAGGSIVSTTAGTITIAATTTTGVITQPITTAAMQSVSQVEMESLRKQIDVLQLQLANSQRALKAASTSSSTQMVTGNILSEYSGGSSSAQSEVDTNRPSVTPQSYVTNDQPTVFRHSQPPPLQPAPSAVAQPSLPTSLPASQSPLTQPFNAVQQPPYYSNFLMPPLPKKLYDLPNFSGVPEDWPMFSTAFEHSTTAYQYNNFENCVRLQKALKGDARECVKSLLIHPDNVNTVMEQLKFQYGRPELLIRGQLKQVREIPSISENAVEKLVPFAIKVQNLAAFLGTANGHQHLSNPTLMDELIQKLPMSKRLEWAQYSSNLESWPTVLDFNNWLKGVANLIRSVQLTTTSRPTGETKKKVVLYASDDRDKEEECRLCRGQHNLFDCKKFHSMSVPNRWNEVKKLRLCFSCLGSGHSTRNCRRRKECHVNGCQRKHNKLLHDKSKDVGENNSNSVVARNDQDAEPVLSCVSSICEKSNLLFRVLPVKLYGPNCVVETFALLDEGSSVTMIDSSLVRQLGLSGRQSKLNLSWYGGKSSQESAMVVDLHVSGTSKKRKYALKNVYGVPNLKLPTQSFNMKSNKHYEVPVKPYSNVTPKMLIGLDHCHLGLPDEVVPLEEGGPYAANTPLGWVVFGQVCGRQPTSHTCLLTAQPEQNLYDLVSSYFETENFGVKALPTIEGKDDVRARHLLKDFTIKVAGRFQSRLLWRDENVVLPDSYSMAFNRLVGIERKMKKNPEFGADYKRIIQDYVNKGYVRKLTSSEISICSPRTWYLPHFGVLNPLKPGKLRLVFDAAAKVEGVSLNSKLLKGPQQYRPLPAVLFNFRMGKVAVCADIKEMFHQIIIAEEDRCSQRFLWRENECCPPDVYEMTVMTFGAACSPCIAQYVKETNALEFRDRYPRAVKAIIDNHYVDDFVDSFETSEKAIDISMQVRKIHKSAGFELRNFTSNSKEVVVALEGNLGRNFNFCDDLADVQFSTEKILGMYWNPGDDAFKFELKFHRVRPEIISGERCPTKRELLSVVMSVYDPLGLLSHFMVTAKLLLREVWRYDIRWDEDIPNELFDIWNNWRDELKNVAQVSVPRHYFGIGLPETVELHIFVDASEDAFGAVSYWRSIKSDGEIEVSFITSKTKCAPLKSMTIPRLELQAAVLGTRLLCTIEKEHSVKVSQRICWSDSSTVINWINSDNRRYKPFVAHRITEILDSTRPTDWKWLPTNLNVADETTRAKRNMDFSFNSRWYQGPQFLHEPDDDWPEMISTSNDEPPEEELRSKFVLTVSTNVVIDFNRFSSFLRIKRTMGYVLRFVERYLKKKIGDGETCLTVAELKDAETVLCRLSQRESFAFELDILKSGGSIPKSSELYSLSPYIDENNLMRVYGRIDAASCLPIETRRPIILSPKHRLAELIVVHEHKLMKHQNFEATIAAIRRRYWIPRLRKLLKSCISKCNVCKLRSVSPTPPFMGSLPSDRLTPNVRPFAYTGLDYFGPITITIGRRHEKRWVALFTCLTIRAIHLEIAVDLSTDACILAIRNFINRRGTPIRIRSDNGKNFVGADQEAKRFQEVFDVIRVKDELSTKGIDWQFNCPYNPSEGGIWERMVQCVKKILRVTLKEVAPREHTLHSFLIEAENIVNSRPLTHLPVGPDEEEPLTPNHFLLGHPNMPETPAGTIVDKPAVLKKQWRISRQLRDHFWKRWIAEYLPTLTRRAKWCQYTKPVAPGDLVLICDPDVSRREWRRGRVQDVYLGKDGVVRQADIATSTGVLKRPVSKLAVLDVE
ncbi:uncharacterized protein [Musca autumnalis]|uniref:uncharacterized protein n=1 Tax=Musca autumnalis TaxID=221902 RepID=UPI003CEA2DC0